MMLGLQQQAQALQQVQALSTGGSTACHCSTHTTSARRHR
jgi:hypothetical protein